MSDPEKIIEKVLNDSQFASDLVANPESALGAMGVEVTPEIVSALKSLDVESLQRLVTAFGKQQAAF